MIQVLITTQAWSASGVSIHTTIVAFNTLQRAVDAVAKLNAKDNQQHGYEQHAIVL